MGKKDKIFWEEDTVMDIVVTNRKVTSRVGLESL